MNDKSRLLWRCRRGIREMDILLESFMEKYYPDLSDEDKRIFESFLDETDPDILNWIMGRTEPENQAYKPLLEILQSPDTDT